MKTLFHKELCDREFGSAVVATSELRAWAATQGLQLRTVPSLDEFDHVQIEALLCAVERAVAKTYSSDDALEIIRHRPDLMEHRIAAMAVKECFAGPDVIWLLGADAHKQWRTKIGEAIDAGDLTLLDPASLLPIEATRTLLKVNNRITESAHGAGRPRTAREIRDAFPNAAWGDRLTKCTSGKYDWLRDTWSQKGSRKPGDATTFYPAKVCASAVSVGFLTLAECDTAFKKHFPDWQNEWDSESELLRR